MEIVRGLHGVRAGIVPDRIEVPVAIEFKRRTVEAVRTALCDNTDDTS